MLQIADGADKMARTNHEVEFLTGRSYNLPIPMDLKPPLNQLKK